MELKQKLFSYSVFKLLVPFLLGIVLQIKGHIFSSVFLYIMIFLWLILLILNNSKKIVTNYFLHSFFGIATFFLMIVIGIIITYFHQKVPDYSWCKKENNFIVEVLELPQKKQNSISVKSKILFPKKITSKCILYLEPGKQTPQQGDILIIYSKINKIKNFGNPYEFDYKNYLANRGIFFQAYVKKSQWKIIAKNKNFNLFYTANKIREKVLIFYQKNQLSGNELAIVSALTLGYKDWLSPETKDVFSKTGAIHILAVSGLHVGIIYMIISFLLQIFNKIKNGPIIKSIILIVCIWSYAFITGLSPSIQRASLMFSIVALSGLIDRQVTIYQSLALSAFVILLINPYFITEVGFQLSYLAVFGIVYFQPKISKLIIIKNKIVAYFWDLMAVSIAAQIVTFPLSLFYFHQFPIIFLIVNLLVIPLAFMVLFTAFFSLVFAFLPFVSYILIQAIFYLTRFIYNVLSYFQSFSWATLNNIYFNEVHLLLTFLFILFLSIFFIQKSGQHAVGSLLIISIIIGYNTFVDYRFNRTKKFVVYNNGNTSLHAFYKHKNCYVMTSASTEELFSNYSIQNDWLNSGIKKEKVQLIDFIQDEYENNSMYIKKIFNNSISFIQLNNIKIVCISNKVSADFSVHKKLAADYLILSNNANVSINRLMHFFTFKKVIFDSSNNYYKTQKWIKECIEANLEYHFVNEQGAFQVNL